jgi:predicted lipoprotein with Yx(FWY)xxD motif
MRRITMRFVAKAHLRRHAALVGAVALSAGVVAGILPSLDAPASAAPRTSAPVLLSINTASYPRVLGNSKKYSLYLLHDEAGGKLHCVGKCLQSWIPLYVAKGSHPSVGAGVKGKLGTVARKLSKADTKYQLTYNSFPVYTFSGDTARVSSSPPVSTGTCCIRQPRRRRLRRWQYPDRPAGAAAGESLRSPVT